MNAVSQARRAQKRKRKHKEDIQYAYQYGIDEVKELVVDFLNSKKKQLDIDRLVAELNLTQLPNGDYQFIANKGLG